MRARFVWRDGYVDHDRVLYVLPLLWKRVVPETTVMDWQSGDLPVAHPIATAVFRLVRFADGSFEYREEA